MPDCKTCKTCPNPNGYKLCNQPYALCSKADCVLDKKTNKYICKCENFKGCSMGTESCANLKSYTDKKGNKIIFSTFSPEFGKKGYTLNTGPSNQWANCLNQKCVVDPKNPKKSVCSCVVASGTEVTYNDKSLTNVSGASLDSFLQTTQYWESCLGENLLKINQDAYKIKERQAKKQQEKERREQERKEERVKKRKEERVKKRKEEREK